MIFFVACKDVWTGDCGFESKRKWQKMYNKSSLSPSPFFLFWREHNKLCKKFNNTSCSKNNFFFFFVLKNILNFFTNLHFLASK